MGVKWQWPFSMKTLAISVQSSPIAPKKNIVMAGHKTIWAIGLGQTIISELNMQGWKSIHI